MAEFKSNHTPSLKRGFGKLVQLTAIVQSGMTLEAISDSNFKRNVLPEPFDFPDHIGNFKEGSLLTAAFGGMVGMLVGIEAMVDYDSEKFKKRAKIAAAAGFVLSGAVQFIAEKYGINNVVGGTNVGDMTDAVYGTTWSAVTAGIGYKYAVGVFEDAQANREARRIEWNEWYEANKEEVLKNYNDLIESQGAQQVPPEITD